MTDTTQKALDALRSAFPPHPLDTQGAFADWGVSYTDGAKFKAGTHGRPWDALPAQLLVFHCDALGFLGPQAVADVIPAFLAAVLRQGDGLGMLPAFLLDVLTRGAEPDPRFDARFGGLSEAQRRAVRGALEAWEAAVPEGSGRRGAIGAALASHWRT